MTLERLLSLFRLLSAGSGGMIVSRRSLSDIGRLDEVSRGLGEVRRDSSPSESVDSSVS